MSSLSDKLWYECDTQFFMLVKTWPMLAMFGILGECPIYMPMHVKRAITIFYVQIIPIILFRYLQIRG
jgi:hypothetical protein